MFRILQFIAVPSMKRTYVLNQFTCFFKERTRYIVLRILPGYLMKVLHQPIYGFPLLGIKFSLS